MEWKEERMHSEIDAYEVNHGCLPLVGPIEGLECNF